MDHSEFPWGPQYEPGLLTPLGVFGWIVAAALLIALIIVNARGGGGAKGGEARLEEIHTVILKAARHALKQQYFGSPGAAHMLRQVIKDQLGGVQTAGEALTKQLKALDEALGEKKDDKKKDDKKGHDAHGGHGAHGGGHGAHGAHEAAHGGQAGHGGPSAGATATTVQGHSITVNVGGGHGPEVDHEPVDEEDKPKTLAEQLVAVEKAVRDFEVWWQNKPVRLGELRMAQDDLTRAKKLDAVLAAQIEEKKHH